MSGKHSDKATESARERNRILNQKVSTLEQAVMHKTPEEVGEVMKSLGSFEFTARALGIACRNRGLEMVKVLKENGASFSFPDTVTVHVGTYMMFEPWSHDIYTYEYNWKDFSPMIFEPIKTTLYTGGAPETRCADFDYLINLDDIGVLPLAERLEILEYLLDNAEALAVDVGDLLYYSVLLEEKEIYDLLKSRGVVFSEKAVTALTQKGGNYWYRFCSASNYMSVPALCNMLEQVGLEIGEKKLRSPDEYFDICKSKQKYGRFVELYFRYFNMARVNKTEMLKRIIDNNTVGCLPLAEEYGWLKMPSKRDQLIQYATEQKQAEAAAWLIDFKNRTADLKAEREKAEKQLQKELNTDPNSPAEIKRNWGFVEEKNGEVTITVYKGKSTVVIIPEKINGKPVTKIDSWAVSPHSSNIREEKQELRRKITKVVVPPSVRFIGDSAFRDLPSLETVEFHEGLKKIGAYAFSDCGKLHEIIIPEGVREIGVCAFGCMGGNVAGLETAELPSTLNYFKDGNKLSYAYKIFADCPNLVVTIPKSIFAVRYCKKFNLNYVIKKGTNENEH